MKHHIMSLNHDNFEKIKQNKKYELRLMDDKRSQISPSDICTFRDNSNNKTLDCLVINLHVYPDFETLYQHHDKISLGYDEDEEANPDDMLKYYSKEDIKRYQAVAIELMVLPGLFCDLDGVIADFDRGVKELCNLSPFPMNDNRDLDKENEMWLRIKEVGHFYDKLELMPDAKEMFDLIYRNHPNFVILTGIPKEERGITTATEDKINWVHRHLSKDIQIIVVDSEEKSRYCCTGKDILIDDSRKCVNAWVESGGIGILHKRPQTTLKKLKELGII